MKRRLFNAVMAIYPPAWRTRYREELSDLCEELIAAREATPARLAMAILPRALIERVRAPRPRVLFASAAVGLAVMGAAVLWDGFGLAGSASPPVGWLGPHSALHSRLVRLPAGKVEMVTTMREPGGYLLLARVSAPAGMRVEVFATQLVPPPSQYSAVFSTFRLAHNDILLSCRAHAGATTCTQGGLEWCPLGPSVWRLQVVKNGGPAGLAQVDLIVGERPVDLSQARTDSWVARFDASWKGAGAAS